MPSYLREALDHLNPNVPSGWAYTLTTSRNEQTFTERFDPAKTASEQWTLVAMDGRTPTAAEVGKYRRARSAGSGGMQANFQKNDIDPGSVTLVREDDERAEFTAAFRETSAAADKMLAHLVLRLTVDKRNPHVVAYTLSLQEPYNPVLGVKMTELQVHMMFTPPEPGRPSLPREVKSRFAGKIFFIPTGETLQLTYRDYSSSAAELSR